MRPNWKNKVKKAGGMAQVLGGLPSKCKVLSSNPSTTKRKKEEERKDGWILLEELRLVKHQIFRALFQHFWLSAFVNTGKNMNSLFLIMYQPLH
jgi:hypothetical protein